MRKIIIGGIAAALGVSTVLASGAFASNQDNPGARKAALLYTPEHNADMEDTCTAGSGPVNGFVILNAPGNPALGIDRVLGEISLKNGEVGTYEVDLSVDGGDCQNTLVTLTTNDRGFGNAHIDLPTTGTDFYVVLKALMVAGEAPGDEVYASTPVTLS